MIKATKLDYIDGLRGRGVPSADRGRTPIIPYGFEIDFGGKNAPAE
jgi:hypothetical protein